MSLFDRIFNKLCLFILCLLFVVGTLCIVLGFLTLVEKSSQEIVLTVEENKPLVIEQVKQRYYNITEEERYLLAKLAHSEASVCSQECQQDVVSVVFNRVESGRWKKDMNEDGVITLYDIIYYPNAFTPATNGAIDKYEPTAKDYAAVDYVLTNGPTLPKYVRYFRTSHDFSWDGYLNYKTIDNVYFGYFEDWEKGVW